MKVTKTPLEGLVVIEPSVFEDARGYFFESYNLAQFAAQGLADVLVQDNQSRSSYGVVRGLHYQLNPNAQIKLVRAIEGTIFDVAVDIRQQSPTFGQWFGIELSADNKKQLWIPAGFAHGFSVLSQSATVLYKCNSFYCREAERSIAYNDATLNIDWRIAAADALISDKDRQNPAFAQAEHNFVRS